MLYDVVENAGAASAAELRSAIERELRRVVDAAGVDGAATTAGVPDEVVAAVAAGDSHRLTLEQAAALFAVDPDAPDADAIIAETRDHLLLGMTTGVIDVDTLADDVDGDLTGQELQQVIEGRAPMTLDQFVAIERAIASRNDR